MITRFLKENELNCVEKIDLLRHYLIDHNSVLALGFNIEMPDEKLIQSLKLFKKKHSLFSATIELTDGIKLIQHPEKEIVFQNKGKIINKEQLYDLIYEESRNAFDPQKELMLRLTKVTYQDLCVLLFSVDHILVDGMSFVYFISDFIKIVMSSTIIAPATVSTPHRPDVLNLSPDENQALDENIKRILSGPPVKKYHGMGFTHIEIETTDTLNLVQRCQKHHVSLHNAVLTAMALALVTYYDQTEMTINFRTAINLRSLLKVKLEDALGDYHSEINTLFLVSTSVNFWEIARYLNKDIEESVSKNAPFEKLKDAISEIKKANDLANYQELKKLNFPTISISSRKVTLPASAKFLKFSFGIGPYNYSNNPHFFTYAAINHLFENTLRLTFEYDAQHLTKTQINFLIHHTVNFLLKAE